MSGLFGRKLAEPLQLITERLRLRQWRTDDHEPFAALNADPVVMEHFPAPLTRAEADAMITRCAARIEQHGWGLWAVDTLDDETFLGFVGLNVPTFEAAFMPRVEIGWRLGRSAWGHGYATEAAVAALQAAFGPIGLDEVVSFTATTNVRSERVMQRLGMRHDQADDFDQPRLPEGHRLRRHVLYRLSASQYALQRAQGTVA